MKKSTIQEIKGSIEMKKSTIQEYGKLVIIILSILFLFASVIMIVTGQTGLIKDMFGYLCTTIGVIVGATITRKAIRETAQSWKGNWYPGGNGENIVDEETEREVKYDR